MAEFTSRERLLTALRHEEPDRVPIDLGGFVSTIEEIPFNKLKDYLGKKWETKCFLRDHVEIPEELKQMFNVDTRYVRLKAPSNWKMKLEEDNSWLDEWGTRWKKPPTSLYWDPVGHPLKSASIKDIGTYPWPDPDDPNRFEGVREEAERLRNETDYAIIADTPVYGIFEHSWTCLRGSEFFTDMVLNEGFVHALFEKLLEIDTKLFANYMDAVGDLVDVVCVGDDLGSENAPLVSPEMYRKLIKPYQAKLWGSIKAKTDAYLFLHSCGSIYKLIPDLIEMGVNILNPVQVAAKDMDSKKLKSEFGKDLSFWGGIDTQKVLPFGSTQDVEAEVKKRLSDLAPGGGYVLNAVHCIQPGVPPENIVQMYKTGNAFGKYPIGKG
jgi:uroporphyrinogen decarboxylase